MRSCAKPSIRTCVSCKKQDRKTALIRVGCVEGELILDKEGKLAGRGAYLHPRRECLHKGLSIKWDRVFRMDRNEGNKEQPIRKEALMREIKALLERM